MSKPYQRTEAEEMARFFANLIKNRTFLNQITKKWMLIPEKESLSTLENIINSKKIIKSRKIDKDNIFIFCEHTREKRIKTLAKRYLTRTTIFRYYPLILIYQSTGIYLLNLSPKKNKLSLNIPCWP
jgi:hypothetical protein